MENRTLQDALEAERRLCIALLFTGGQHRRGLFDEGFEFLPQSHNVHRTGFQCLSGRRVTEQRQ